MSGISLIGAVALLALGVALFVLSVLAPYFVYRIYREAVETNRLLRLLCRAAGQESEPRTGREYSR